MPQIPLIACFHGPQSLQENGQKSLELKKQHTKAKHDRYIKELDTRLLAVWTLKRKTNYKNVFLEKAVEAICRMQNKIVEQTTII